MKKSRQSQFLFYLFITYFSISYLHRHQLLFVNADVGYEDLAAVGCGKFLQVDGFSGVEGDGAVSMDGLARDLGVSQLIAAQAGRDIQ